jgi:hypothetical protein
VSASSSFILSKMSWFIQLIADLLGLGAGTRATAMAGEIRTRPRLLASVGAAPRYTAITQSTPHDTGTLGVRY